MNLLEFKKYLIENSKSENTIKSYMLNIQEYFSWFKESYGKDFEKLYRQNVLEFKSYLLNVKKYNDKNLSAKTINLKLSALKSFNKFLIKSHYQNDLTINDNDFLKIQVEYANPTNVDKIEIEKFRQRILESSNKRLYAIVTLLAYSGLRISEALNIKLEDINLESREVIIKSGKGSKQRIVYLNTKVVESIKEYLNSRINRQSDFLFTSQKSNQLTRTVVNKEFNKYSNTITPHTLRHFFCTNALENGFAIHEVANIAGHSNIQTTLIYTNPNRKQLKNKTELL